MTADPPASERAYRQLTTDILEGALPVEPLDVERLGERVGLSATPLLEVLARLSAERFVQVPACHGSAIADASTHRLHHLYELNGVLIDLSLAGLVRSLGRTGVATATSRPADYASGITHLCREIAAAQPNLDLADRVAEIGDRLLAARRCELIVFPAAAETHAALCVLWDRRDIKALRHLLRAHHEVRAARADAIAQVLNERAGAAEAAETLDF